MNSMSFKDIKVGDSVFVQSYKHDGSLHRTWSKAYVIDVFDNCVVAVTDHTWVVEADKRKWLTKEPAICFYYNDVWFNIISMVRKTGIYYYCNLASPSLYDGEAVKNIDYDLDVKVFPDGSYIKGIAPSVTEYGYIDASNLQRKDFNLDADMCEAYKTEILKT